MSATTRASIPHALEQLTRDELVEAVLGAVGLDEVDPRDVLTVHIGTRAVGIRRKVRGRRGRVVPGMTTTTTHRIIPEPYEDE